MGLLDQGLPCAVEVAGEAVRVRTGFRTGLMASAEQGTGPDAMLRLLALLFGPLDGLPDAVADHPVEAVEAGRAWVAGAWGLMAYGADGGRTGGRRVFDADEDAAIVACDFQRLYGVDLLSDETQMHWYRFIALLLGAMRTDGTLVAQAVAARSEHAPAKGARERRRQAALRKAWRLSPTEEELAARARREFG